MPKEIYEDLMPKILEMLKDATNGYTLTELAEKLNVSATPVSKAILLLEQRKQIEIIDYGSAKVVKLVTSNEKR